MKKAILVICLSALAMMGIKAQNTYTVNDQASLVVAIHTINARSGGDTIQITNNINLTGGGNNLLPKITKPICFLGDTLSGGIPKFTIDAKGVARNTSVNTSQAASDTAYVLHFTSTAKGSYVFGLSLINASDTLTNTGSMYGSAYARAFGLFSADSLAASYVTAAHCTSYGVHSYNAIGRSDGIFVEKKATLTNCSANHNRGSGKATNNTYGGNGYSSGISVGGGSITNCFANHNSGYGVYSGAAYGININAGTGVVIANCTANHNLSNGNTHGIFFSTNTSGSVINCTANNNYGNTKASGIDLTPTSNAYNCIALGNVSSRANSFYDFSGGIVYNSVYTMRNYKPVNNGFQINGANTIAFIAKDMDGNTLAMATAADTAKLAYYAINPTGTSPAVFVTGDSMHYKAVRDTLTKRGFLQEEINRVLHQDIVGTAREYTQRGNCVPGAVTAAIPAFNINATVNAGGNINPAGDSTVLCSDSIAYTFNNTIGYYVDRLLIDGVNTPDSIAGGRYTFTDVMADHSIRVVFAIIPTTITRQPEGGVFCKGSSWLLYVETTGLNVTYQWYRDDVAIDNAIDSTYTSDTEGIYSVTVSGADGVTLTSEKVMLSFPEPLPAEPEFLLIPSVMHPNESYRVIVGRPLGFYKYVSRYAWSFSNDKVTISPEAFSSPNAWLQTGAIPESGVLTVNLTHVCGEERTLSSPITFKYPTGIDNLGVRGVKVFPNPVMEELKVESGERKVEHVTVTDLNGRLVYQSSNPAGNPIKIATGHWVKGWYLVKVMTKDGLKVVKVVK